MTKKVRCGIYTRKSSEEGLEQSFNSLHAQREACEAYVLSQSGEGWVALPTIYDDGGFSGGSMDRPALTRLLADIGAGKIDVVVVYKVDRLTRSLFDFAKIVETFDAKGVSFVSVTQAFNTTTSMGRLTLNVLLSFAQFEREVTGERIRDKIAASKAKGMWMGGVLPLGYDAPTDPVSRALVVNPAEAETVRQIFRRYLELGSVHALRDWLADEGIRSKVWMTRAGRRMGGQNFQRGALFHLLRNPTYVGEIPHRDKSYPDAHPPIIDREMFEAVQASLDAAASRHQDRPLRGRAAKLKGRIFDELGRPMCPSFTRKTNGASYRYYVSAPLTQGVRPQAEGIWRLPGEATDDQVRTLLGRLGAPSGTQPQRVEIRPSGMQMLVKRADLMARPGDAQADLGILQKRMGVMGRITLEDDGVLARITLDGGVGPWRGRVRFEWKGQRAERNPSPDKALIQALKRGHAILAEDGGVMGRPEVFEGSQGPAQSYHRRLACLAFLAPDIQTEIIEGRQPPQLTLERVLTEGVPPSWEDQRQRFGFPAHH